MKISLKNILLILPFCLLFPNLSIATSGACSYHGGVNCLAGASIYGNAICNDGWESSTNYYSTVECSISAPNCPAPVPYGATDIYICQQYQNICDRTNASKCQSQSRLKSSPENCVISTECPDADICRTQVENWNAQKEAYNQCWDEAKKLQIIELEQLSQNYENLSCKSEYGTNSIYDIAAKKCVCQEGYLQSSKTNLCETPPTICKEKHGINAVFIGESCACASEYRMDAQWQCVPLDIKFIPEKTLGVAKSGSCFILPDEKERALCVDYQLHQNIYTWKIPAPDTTKQPVSLPTKTPDVVLDQLRTNIVSKPAVQITNRPKGLSSSDLEKLMEEMERARLSSTTPTNTPLTQSSKQDSESQIITFWQKLGMFIGKLNPFSWFR